MWLEVTYQGRNPPTDLFADLALVGWTPPTPAPPPHDAIDWSQPNEATGERFTLRDYTVEGAVAQPPAGTASRGTWTDAERSTHLAALGRVLDRHPTIEIDDPGGLVRSGASVEVTTPPVAPLPSAPPPPPPPPAPAFVLSPATTAVLITAPLKPSLAPRAEDALVALDATVVFDSQERVRTERYRGANHQTTVTELHLAAIVAPAQIDAAVAALTRLGLTLTFAEVDDVAVALEAPGTTVAPAAEPAAAPESAPGPSAAGLATVVVLADPRAAGAIDEVIGSLGLVDTTAVPTTRLEVSTYRGSRSERQVQTLRVEARVPEPHARLVANHLAEAAYVRIDDLERLWIVPPELIADPAADTAAVATADPRRTAPAPDRRPPPPVARLAPSAAPVQRSEPTLAAGRPQSALVDHGG